MTDEKKKDDKDRKKLSDEELEDVAGGDVQLRGSGRTQTIYYFGKEDKDKEGNTVRGTEST
jgi:hypothetical protein